MSRTGALRESALSVGGGWLEKALGEGVRVLEGVSGECVGWFVRGGALDLGGPLGTRCLAVQGVCPRERMRRAD